jgi:hypothetical protein
MEYLGEQDHRGVRRPAVDPDEECRHLGLPARVHLGRRHSSLGGVEVVGFRTTDEQTAE